MCFEKMLQVWKSVFKDPKKTFKKEGKKADLGLGAKHILFAGAVTGVILGIASLNPLLVVILPFLYPMLSFIGWLIGVGIIFLFALLLGGKGKITTQGYLTAIYAAPISIVSAVLTLIPVVGIWLNIAVSIYALYLLTLVLKETHKYSTGRAILTWLLPVIIIAIFVAAMFALVFAYYVSSISPMMDISQVLV
jgi:hypothetical protein